MQEVLKVFKINEQQFAYTNWSKNHFKNGDFDITLTFKPVAAQYKFGYQPNLSLYENHVGHFLNKVNYRFFGRAYKTGKKRLKVINVFELNFSQGVHCHMILEKPEFSKIEPAQHLTELKQIWKNCNACAYIDANKFRYTRDAEGWISYILKNISQNNSEYFDVSNTFLG